MISEQYKTIFIHIPRNGGVSVEKTLLNEVESDQYSMLDYFMQGKYQTIQEIQGEKYEEYHKWTIVRNPWEREAAIYNSLQEKSINSSQSFEDYLDMLTDLEDLESGINKSQTSYFLVNNNVMIDQIVRIEVLRETWPRICQNINCQYDNIAHHNKARNNNYRELYSTKTRKMVEKLRQKDIEFLNYDYPY
jgi:hypothetical protein